MKKQTLGFLGFGLIGGSIARTLKKRCPENAPQAQNELFIHVYTRRNNPDLDTGVEEGVIDKLHYEIGEWLSECDIIFLCAPVLINIRLLEQIKPFITPDCIVTDVGSVKGNIHTAVNELGMENNFIGGHPMAGSEKVGYINSTTTLLENAYYLLTTSKQVADTADYLEKLNRMETLVKRVGSICVILDPKEHDRITAAISHVPHIIATSLVNMVRLSDDDNENMKHFAAGGFKDITRIASSSPEMWQNICLSNVESIHDFLITFQNLLSEFDNMLANHDEENLRNTFLEAGTYRDSIPTKKASVIKRFYEIYIDIADETGAIATVSTLLASNAISIKNIGILHNREFEEGALRIEFYDENAKQKAASLLESHHYHIHR